MLTAETRTRTAKATTGTATCRQRSTPDTGPRRSAVPGRSRCDRSCVTATAVFRRRTSAMKNGAPISASTMPTCNSPGAGHHAADDVGDQQQGGAAQPGAGDQPPVVGAGEGAHHVRHDEADERDRPAGGGGGPAEQGDRGQPDGAGQPDPLAETAGDVLTEAQQVERGGVRQRQHQADRDEGSDLPRRSSAPRPASDPTTQNRKLSSVWVSPTRSVRTRANIRADSAAPASARVTGVAPPPGRADRVDQHGAGQRADEGEPDVARRRADAEHGDREDDGERGAGGDAEQPGVAERVAGVPLHQGAGDAQRHARP